MTSERFREEVRAPAADMARSTAFLPGHLLSEAATAANGKASRLKKGNLTGSCSSLLLGEEMGKSRVKFDCRKSECGGMLEGLHVLKELANGKGFPQYLPPHEVMHGRKPNLGAGRYQSLENGKARILAASTRNLHADFVPADYDGGLCVPPKDLVMKSLALTRVNQYEAERLLIEDKVRNRHAWSRR